MYKDEFGNSIKESGICTQNPFNENQVIFVDTGNIYEFINGIMDIKNPYVELVGEVDDITFDNLQRMDFDDLPTPLEASILIEDNNKLRWEH